MKLRSSTICFLAVIVSILNNAGIVEATEENIEALVKYAKTKNIEILNCSFIY